MARDVVWSPTPEQVRDSNVQAFMRQHGCSSLDQLQQRSTAEPEWFWDAVVRDLGIAWRQPYARVMDTAAGIAWTRWFTGGRLNIAESCLDRHVREGRGERTAVIWEGEEGQTQAITYAQLKAATHRLAHGLRGLGLGPGDTVGLYLPMVPEAVVATLACARIGAVIVPIFSGYGPGAVAARLQDSGAQVLITADGFCRRGKAVEMKAVADQAAEQCPDLRHTVVVRRLGREPGPGHRRDVEWADLASGGPDTFPTAELDAEAPLMLIYTSGTTGRPKGAVHTHCGFPIKGAQDMKQCFDVRPDDVVFWLSDLGWMMGPWLIYGTLILGSAMVLYDGSPDHPDPARLWQMVQRHRISVLGVSPTLIRVLMQSGAAPRERHDLGSLRILGSTGEPWNPDPYLWFLEQVGGGRCPIINYSGGTEVSGGILGCFPVTPLRPCSFSGPIPGMAVDVVDPDGGPVRGQVGELVIRQPWPGMTRGFWRDAARYEETYWSRLPGVWVHGDWALVDDAGFWYIQGRSDDTLNVAGKRVGPAEVESALVAHPAVTEAAAIGVPDPQKGETIVCFVVLAPGYQPAEPLRAELSEQVVQELGKSLRPKAVKFVEMLPKTRNGKVMRRVIRGKFLGTLAGQDLSAVENLESVEAVQRAR